MNSSAPDASTTAPDQDGRPATTPVAESTPRPATGSYTHPNPRPGFGMPEEAPDAHLPSFPGTYALSIWALVAAFAFPAAGLIMAIVALRNLRRRKQAGRGLAQAAAVIAGIQTVLLALALSFFLLQPDLRDDSGAVQETRSVDIAAVRPGDCLVLPRSTGVLTDVFVTPCSSAHNTEVFAVLKMPAGSWPGDEAIETQAAELCFASLTAYAPAFDTDMGDFLSLQPQEAGWRLGDRGLICLVQTPITRVSIRD